MFVLKNGAISPSSKGIYKREKWIQRSDVWI